jgi:dUTP pyrophosphatase
MNVNFKKTLPNAVIPSYAKPDDNGLDLFIVERTERGVQYEEFDTGIAVEIPPGYVGLVVPRSSISTRSMVFANTIGVIDSSYRGSIKFRFKLYPGYPTKPYVVGEKAGQLLIVPAPTIELKEVKELSETARNSAGFGSTGN